MSNIQGIRLSSGEELIAEVVNTTLTSNYGSGQLIIKNPLEVRMQATPDGVACGFYPWTVIAKGEIHLNRDLVVAHYPVPDDVQDAYLQNVTGLQIVSEPPTRILNG